MSKHEKYVDNEGYAWMMLVDDDMPVEYGVVLGPYYMDHVVDNKEDQKKLQEALVDAGLYNAHVLLNRRRDLRDIVRRLGLPDTTERKIVSIFQQIYYKEYRE